MPMSITNTAGGNSYGNPFVGPIDHPDHLRIDVSALTTDEVDTYGNLKPGVPFTKTGLPVTTGLFVYGVTIEAVKIVPNAPTNTSLGLVTVDPLVAVATIGLVNRDIVEDNLGRALTAFEIAGFDLAGSKLALTST